MMLLEAACVYLTEAFRESENLSSSLQNYYAGVCSFEYINIDDVPLKSSES